MKPNKKHFVVPVILILIIFSNMDQVYFRQIIGWGYFPEEGSLIKKDNLEALEKAADQYAKSGYGKYLKMILDNKHQFPEID